MNMPNPPQGLSWEVTGSSETSQLGTGNTLVRGRQVEFRTGSNGTGTVFIPDNVTSTEAMKAIVAHAAARVDEMNSLTSGD